MDTKTLNLLEFPKILARVAAFASSCPAKEEILNIKPMDSVDEIRLKLKEVEEADRLLYEFLVNPNFAIDDISPLIEKAEKMSVLSISELVKIARFLRISASVRQSVCKIEELNILKAMAKNIYLDKSLEDELDKAILSDTELSDNASTALRDIRIRIKKVGDSIRAKLQSYVSSSEYGKYIQDNIVTIRGDRYVIPLKAEYKGAIAGLIHDISSSGQTLYVEPMAIVELNNTLKTHILEEQEEIERILKAFTLRISGITESLFQSFSLVTYLDTVFAKAKYSQAIKGVMPTVNDKGCIDIRKGRHPLIDPKAVIASDINLGKEFDILFITGPNTGGKTVQLKLVGLVQNRGMSGLFVPAVQCEISTFNNIFCDIGDEQSIEQSLSTFSSHISNIVKITNNLDSKTLILLDELGAGTDPTEGAALAVAISSFIKQSRAKAIITTHYNELKEYAVVTEGVENASMDFDPITYNPTYKLIISTPGASNAILISQKLGLDERIIKAAKDGIKGEQHEFLNVLHNLEEARRKAIVNEEKTAKLLKEAECIRETAEKEKARLFLQREKLNENVRKETKRLVEEAMLDANDIIDSLKQLLDEPSEESLFKARRLRKSLNKYVVVEENEFEGFGEEAEGELELNDTVLIQSLKVEGRIASINKEKNTAVVKMGGLQSKFSLNDLIKLKPKVVKEDKTPKKGSRELNNQAFNAEINLIGKNVLEAVHELEAYIDKALVIGVNEIRVIHGSGSGALRKGIRDYLRGQKSYLGFRDATQNEGGYGATIILIKR